MAFEKKPNPPCFERQLKDIIKKFPNSEGSIRTSIEGLAGNADTADSIPRLGGHLKKLRLSLSAYNLSKRRGLRIVFMVNGGAILPVAIYYKGDGKSEADIIDLIKRNLKEILGS